MSYPSAPKITYAFCTYNRADRLEVLVKSMRNQDCPIEFEILAVNNNSQDNTLEVLENLAKQDGPKLRIVTENIQGIVAARNRAIEESIQSDILVFIDDDELPLTGCLNAATDAILNEGADCVGGLIEINFNEIKKPKWLGPELLGFLGALSYPEKSFWINSKATPIWSGNIAFSTKIFRENPTLRFDCKYNRIGNDIGGGEDAIMFRELIDKGYRLRYRSDMAIHHMIEPWKLNISYFLRLHFKSGYRLGLFEMNKLDREILGIPPFLISQLISHSIKTFRLFATNNSYKVRQFMNAAFSFGQICGYISKNSHSSVS